MSEGGIPFTNQERTYLQDCRTNSFLGSLVPSIVFGATVRRACGERFPYRNVVGVVATSAIAATLHAMSKTICLRTFAEQPLFPTAVAFRTTLRGTHPGHYLVKEFDKKFPGHDEEAARTGETRLGRVPFEYVFERKLMEDVFYESDERAKKELAKQQQQQRPQAPTTTLAPPAQSEAELLAAISQSSPPPPSAPLSNPHLPAYSTETLRDAYDKTDGGVSEDPFDLMTSRSSIDADISTDSTPNHNNNQNTRANRSSYSTSSSASSLPSLTSSYSSSRSRPSTSTPASGPTTTELNIFAAPTRVKVKYNQYGDEIYEEEAENKK